MTESVVEEPTSPWWGPWLGLVLAFQAYLLHDATSSALVTRPLAWWAVVVLLALGTLRVVPRPDRAPRWWVVAVVVGPVVWALAETFGASETIVEGAAATATLDGPWGDIGTVTRTANWAHLGRPGMLLLPSAVAAALRWREVADWLHGRHPVAPRLAAGVLAVAVVGWVAMPRAVFDLAPVLLVGVVVPAGVAAGRVVCRGRTWWVALATGPAYVGVLWALDTAGVAGGLSPIAADAVRGTLDRVVVAGFLGLVAWVVAAVTASLRTRWRARAPGQSDR